jgi:hypothetical protein
MNPHDLAADLPPPNADEPASLRQDIVDELADHLTCAARQEALRAELDRTQGFPKTLGSATDEQTIADRVLARFGDPRRIARRLWFDAMKGRLMMQKLTAGFAAIGAAAAIAACVLLWSAVDATKSTLSDVVEENRKDRAASEKADQAMLAQLARLESAVQKPQSPGWNPLRFRLVLGKDGTKPAVGYTVKLQGEPYRETLIEPGRRGGRRRGRSLNKVSGHDGIVNFGLVRPGSYRVTFVSPWDYLRTMDVLVPAGSKTDMTIRCPTERPARTTMKLRVTLPKDLLDRRCALYAEITPPKLKVGKPTWEFPGRSNPYFISSRFGTQRLGELGLGEGQNINYFEKPKSEIGILGILDRGHVVEIANSQDAWTLPYKVQTLAIVLPAYPDLPGNGSTAGGGPMGPMGPISYGQPTQNFVLSYISYGKRRPLGLFSDNPPTFTPQAGRDNVWKITLPPKLIEQARDAMKRVDALEKKKPVPKKPKAA